MRTCHICKRKVDLYALDKHHPDCFYAYRPIKKEEKEMIRRKCIECEASAPIDQYIPHAESCIHAKENQSLHIPIKGMKYDQDKLKYHLFPPESLEEVVKVLTKGAVKYDEFNWRKVDNKPTRYYSALMRHIEAWRLGEMDDPETDCHHLAHAMCCLIFLMQEEIEMPKAMKYYKDPSKENK